MKYSIYLYLFLAGILFILTGCLTYEEVEIVGVTNTDVKSFSAEGAEVDVTLQVSNPNNYKITISNFNLDLFLNGVDLGKAIVENKIVLPKNSNEKHTVTVKLKKMSASAMPAILSAALTGRMKLTAKGTVKAKAKMIGKKVPVEFSENVTL